MLEQARRESRDTHDTSCRDVTQQVKFGLNESDGSLVLKPSLLLATVKQIAAQIIDRQDQRL